MFSDDYNANMKLWNNFIDQITNTISQF